MNGNESRAHFVEDDFSKYQRVQSSGKRRVSFRSSDEVRIFEPDLRYDDEAFTHIAKHLVDLTETELRQKKGPVWLSKFLQPVSPIELDEKKLEKFKDAFRYRLHALHDLKTSKRTEAGNVIRQLALVVQMAGWPDAGYEKENNYKTSNVFDHFHPSEENSLGRDTGASISGASISSLGGYYRTNFEPKRNEVELLSQVVRNRLSNSMSVETILSEIKHLNELSNLTLGRDVKNYCVNEVKVMESMLADMGYTRSLPY